ncbi:MAG: hypothetical protein KAS81_01545 [Anaerolineales bacterium]|nr:hypothetical protein [Anaerolineales bacterium]
MRYLWLAISIALLFVLIGCGAQDGGSPSPAPTGTIATDHATVPQLDDLGAKPDGFEGQRLQISGLFSALPTPFCDSVLHLPPTAWALAWGGIVVQASGLESVLEALATDGLMLTVEGRWVRWEGLLGCGESAVITTMWFLQADRILSPNPLTSATLTPRATGSRQEPATEPVRTPTLTTQVGSPYPTTGTPLPATLAPSASPFITLVPPTWTSTPISIGTPSPTGSPSPTAAGTPSPTSLISPINTPTGPATPTDPLPTPSPPVSPALTPSATYMATFTPIATSDITASPSPSATPAGETRDLGQTYTDEVVNGKLAAGETHRWFFSGATDNIITITAAPAAGVDIQIKVANPAGEEFLKLDSAMAGQAETITALELTEDGGYHILLEAVDNGAGDYSLVVTDQFSIPILFPGNLDYGSTEIESLPAETYHIWHFQGNAGDNVTIRLTPDQNSDLIFELYDPGMGYPIDRVDLRGAGDPEEESYQLAHTGFYSIWVSEYSEEAADYELSVTVEQG